MKFVYLYLYCCIIIYIGLIKFIHGQIQINKENIRRLALPEENTSNSFDYNRDTSIFTSDKFFIESSSPYLEKDSTISTTNPDMSNSGTFFPNVHTSYNTISTTIPDMSNSETEFTNVHTSYNTISTTNPDMSNSETEFTNFSASFNTISTTYPNMINTGTEFTNISASFNTISTTYPNMINTEANFTNISDSFNTISTTYPNMINTEANFTNTPTETTPPTIKLNVKINVVLIGFSHLKQSNSYISFYIYFICKEECSLSDNLYFSVQINYDNNKFLRLLESENKVANCYKHDLQNKKISYICSTEVNNQNINSIKINPDFNFISQESNVEISPFASDYTDNIIKIGNQFDFLLNSNLYILSHSKLNAENNKKIFNISGEINEPNAKFQKNELSLMAYIESKEGNEEKTQLNCKIIDVIINNYILQCEANEYGNYSLFNAISNIENDILFINFDNIADSKISIPPPNSNVGGLNAVSVIAIIIILIFFGYFI